jgi:hypothetical protein
MSMCLCSLLVVQWQRNGLAYCANAVYMGGGRHDVTEGQCPSLSCRIECHIRYAMAAALSHGNIQGHGVLLLLHLASPGC